ncbi:MAG: anthranilate synthase component I family protein [Candidatus Dormibacteria bacterium]
MSNRLAVEPRTLPNSDLVGDCPLLPVWTELPIEGTDPVQLLGLLAADGPGVLLESLDLSGRSGGYTIVAGDPAGILVGDRDGLRLESVRRPLPIAAGRLAPEGSALLASLKEVAMALKAPAVPGVPTMAGGLAGLFSYEAAGLLDGLAFPAGRGLPPAPPVVLLVLDRVVVLDHDRDRMVLVTHVPARAGAEAARPALAELLAAVAGARSPHRPIPSGTAGTLAVAPNVTAEMFRAGVKRIKEDIAAGEIYQAVLSRRLSAPAQESGLAIYERLRRVNPSPAMFYLRLPGVELAGSSPEPLVKVLGTRVSSRPIAGTRRRGRDQHEDERLAAELATDPKERAEHAMLVDLARNDLGKVCRPGSVHPTDLMSLQRFPRVMHLVSNVEGELAEGKTALDALGATFPAGTVTGAPKRRAMEIIAREEPSARGPYAGAAGYLTFSGDLEFCITIRTAVVAQGQVHVQSGAGVVTDSDPDQELAETEAKASAILAALTVPRTRR